ncbi:hypothetical protein N7474_002504 [Penicillium riverlandense]|uniref:uncharacterized protein n=1 Tax=Penicillium riverlandense TaxID=1903569 RepID=UPI0025484B74|nr:uncharacterized protein N7474_002504 [Penicillium riverlandense]KAJ5825366.1 hypothetical protein N7474_002504 [Penicillium riverlandense]
MVFLALAVWLISLYPSSGMGHEIEVDAQAHLPAGASKPVEHAFASFSFPIHFFADYAGNKSQPNRFSQDIIKLLYDKTGEWPYIRVGGTSADRTIYNASQTQAIILSSVSDNGIPLEVTVGPVFFEGFENFYETPWTFQVNFANNKTEALENAIAEAEVALSHIKDNLVAFEIGNEPDLYPGAVRPLNYTVANYVDEWNYFADAISEKVLRGNSYGLESEKLFQALTFASTMNNFTTYNAFKDGIASHGHVKTVSLHQYAAGSFMNHTAIAANLSQYIEDMEIIRANNPTISFLLGETNSDYVNLGMSQDEGVFGSSLWLVDFLLYGMSLNITRFNLIQGTTFGYTAWVPIESNEQSPQVRPPLYGQLLAADVIGKHPKVQVKSLDLGRWDLSAYAIYEGDILSKYVVVNLDEWNSTTPYPRPVQTIALSLPREVKRAEIKRLTGPGAEAVAYISWGGLSWNYTDGRLGEFGQPQVQIFHEHDGNARFSLHSTEAAVIELHRA